MLSPSSSSIDMQSPNGDTILIPPRNPFHKLRGISQSTVPIHPTRRNKPLRQASIEIEKSVPKTTNIERLKTALVEYRFPQNKEDEPSFAGTFAEELRLKPKEACTADGILGDKVDLVEEFGVGGAAADGVLGYDEVEDLYYEEEALAALDDSEGEGGALEDVPRNGRSFKDFQKRIRVKENKRAKMNCRKAGYQNATGCCQSKDCKVCHVFLLILAALFDILPLDSDIFIHRLCQADDVHHLLLYIWHTSERPKRDRRGIDLVGTFLGVVSFQFVSSSPYSQSNCRSHKSKSYTLASAAFVKNTHDPTLRTLRPTTSVHGDALRGRMNQAYNRSRVCVLLLTVLVKEKTLPMYFWRQLQMNKWPTLGRLFVALWTFNPPHGCTNCHYSNGRRINPVYLTLIAHQDSKRSSIGAFAFYHHFLFDLAKVDWSLDKRWRQVQVLHSRKFFVTLYYKQSLYNLYIKAFPKAGCSRPKAHKLPTKTNRSKYACRVYAEKTSRMGLVQGETYYDTYALALPKEVIIHQYRVTTSCIDVSRASSLRSSWKQGARGLRSRLQNQFTMKLFRRDNLAGAANYCAMIIVLRGCLLSSVPPLYKLFSIARRCNLPGILSLLKAKEGCNIDFQRTQNQELRRSLEEMRSLLASSNSELMQLHQLLEQRITVLSPTKALSNEAYQFQTSSRELISANASGVYIADDESGIWAFVNPSLKALRERTLVDVALPPTAPLDTDIGAAISWQQVFDLTKHPSFYGSPSKSLDNLKYSLREQWACYTYEEPVFDSSGTQTGDSDVLDFGALNVYRTILSEKDFDDEFLTYNLAQQPVGLPRSGLILFELCSAQGRRL
ncbi:LOW QUALITY PROTEIN: hypothetical protein CVT26_008887 [Gymnopilus dilepis]|uniref:Uncharacterized protein n=1 Tax=Gymnopilus dilepis TaxID=231916 RepID=A0A409YAZ0_9AGAR|nr:LOW QUALITY PROTEIN: hypothetical protein CVT26_008887 [Gymnopilus dilepis]